MNAPTKPIPVRLDDETQSRVKSAAKRLGLTQAGVMRLSIYQQLAAIESGVIRIAPAHKENAN